MDPNYQLERKCWRKKAYRTSREAQREIKKSYKIYHQRRYKYLCTSCGKYHLTKDLTAKGKIL